MNSSNTKTPIKPPGIGENQQLTMSHDTLVGPISNPICPSASLAANVPIKRKSKPNRSISIPISSPSATATSARVQMSKLVCLSLVAVILTSSTQLLSSVHNVLAQRQDTYINPSHLAPQRSPSTSMVLASPSTSQLQSQSQSSSSSSSSSSQILKDLSGPTSGKIQTLDVICGKNFMTVRAEFSAPFYGIVFSKGTYGQENCIYVKPNSGLTHAAFNVYYDQCGTKPDLQGKFYENTIVIQYGSDIIEAYDEAKRLRCEWFEAYEKPATFKPAIPVADLEVVEMNFQGDDIDCWMEIQEGTGPWSREVAKIVPVGQPMTIVVAINDYNGQFDMRVKSCVAHDGVQQPIALTDEYGCVLRPKMLTPFVKIKNPSTHKEATILSYSRFLAFKFPDSMTVQIQCTVEVCRNGCAEACQRVPSAAATTIQPELSLKAKWPASSHQPSLVAQNRKPQLQLPQIDNSDMANESQPKPSRVQFSPTRSNDYSQLVGDEMKSSDSNNQPAVVHSNPYHQPPAQRNNHQPMQRAQPEIDGRIPQYLTPGMSSRRLSAPNLPSNVNRPVYTTSLAPSTTEPPTTIGPTSVANTIADIERQNNTVYEPAEDNSPNDDQTGSSIQPGLSTVPVDLSAISKPEMDNINLDTAASMENKSIEPPKSGEPSGIDSSSSESINKRLDSNSEQNSNSANNRPSVQGTDELVEPSAELAPTRPQDAQQVASGSSIKTVEVEIPNNADESQPNSQEAPNHMGTVSFNSNGMNFPDIPNASYEPSIALASSSSQVVQPRDSAPQQVAPAAQADRRNDKARDDGHIEDIMMATSSGQKTQFGARSVPMNQGMKSADPAVDSSSSAGSSQFSNHQTAAVSSSSGNTVESVNPSDKVLMDRSDDASISGEPIGEPAVQDNGSVKPDAASSQPDEHQELDGGKMIKPVVGTDELATGIAHLEDRMGSVDHKSNLEDELIKLQQQIPQSAALVASAPAGQANTNQPTGKSESDVANYQLEPAQIDRISSGQKSQMSSEQRDIKQQHPNVIGQAKIITDPMSQLNNRGQMLAQASNQEASFGPSTVAVDSQMRPQTMQVAAKPEQPIDPSKPVAQITNVPIGFSQGKIPSIQQLSQQFAYLQQQQQQQQQQQPIMPAQYSTTTTPKPSRMRFNLLSPQAALQAVASRILPKSFIQSQTQTQTQTQNQQQQQAQQGNKFGLANLMGSSNGQASGPLNAYAMNPAYLAQLKQQYAQQQMTTGGQQAQVPQRLFRTRRSALEPKGARGSGEIGIGKSFMVVTGMDLAFAPNSTDTELPPILEGRRSIEDADVIYGVCMPVVSLTFILTCFFWLMVFLFTFCIYMIIKARRRDEKGALDCSH